MPNRKTLLNVTAKLYSEHGWLGTTTRRIAEAAGVNEVTLFRIFGSKESLLMEAISVATGEHRAAILPAAPANLAAELTSWARTQYDSIQGMSGIIRACLAEWEQRPELAPKVCGGGEIAFVDLRRYLGLAREHGLIGPRGSIDAAAMMLINTVFMDAMTRDVIPGTHPHAVDESIAMYVDLVLRALAAKEIG